MSDHIDAWARLDAQIMTDEFDYECCFVLIIDHWFQNVNQQRQSLFFFHMINDKDIALLDF